MLVGAFFAELLDCGTPKPVVGDAAAGCFKDRGGGGALAATAGLARFMPPGRAPPRCGLSPIPSRSTSDFEPAAVGSDAAADKVELACSALRCAARAFLSAAYSSIHEWRYYHPMHARTHGTAQPPANNVRRIYEILHKQQCRVFWDLRACVVPPFVLRAPWNLRRLCSSE